MSNNLLALLKEYLSGDVVSNLASVIGESPQNTASALQSALPTLLTGLTNKSSDSKSLGDLFNLLTQGNHDGGVLSNLGALSRGGEETNHLLSEGSKLLTAIFGDKTSGVADLIASNSGINKNSASSLLGFIAPVVMGLIGKTLKIGNIENAAGLMSLLSDQSGFIKNLIPASIASLLSGDALSHAFSKIDDPITNIPDAATTAGSQEMSDFDKAVNSLDSVEPPVVSTPKAVPVTETLSHIGDSIENAAEEALSSVKHIAEDIGESAGKFGSEIIDEGKEFTHKATDAFEDTSKKSGGFLPWFLIAVALALVWGLLKSCSTPETTTGAVSITPQATTTAPAVTAPPQVITPPPATTPPPPAEPVVATPPPVEPPPPAAPSTPEPTKVEAPVVDNNSTMFEKTLSTGYTIKAAKDGFESKLVGFIEGNEPISEDLWFTMDGITFNTSKANIKRSANVQINHIAEVLKAYPNVKIKIGGYTDNTGKDSTNQTLSSNRAETVKKALTSKGIQADRLVAEGYGSSHPVATNDNAEGRQQNRRIDVRVTEK